MCVLLSVSLSCPCDSCEVGRFNDGSCRVPCDDARVYDSRAPHYFLRGRFPSYSSALRAALGLIDALRLVGVDVSGYVLRVWPCDIYSSHASPASLLCHEHDVLSLVPTC